MSDEQIPSSRPSKQQRLSLVQKLTLLVALPLLFEVVFAVSLGLLLVAAQSDAHRVERAKETQSIITDIIQTMFRVTTTGFLYSIKKDNYIQQAFDSCKTDVAPQLARLRESCVQDPEAKRASEIVSVLIYRVIDNMDTVTTSGKHSFDAYLRVASGVGYNARTIMKECEKIAAIQRKVHPQISANVDWPSIICGTLIGGIILSVAVSGAAARYLHLDLLQRLKVMMVNTESIARRKPLLPPVAGADELAALDRFIHATDDSLRQLEQTRQEFMSVLTHDMRAPLTHMQFSVEILADPDYETTPEKRQQMLKSLVPEISRLNRLVEDLLTANKLDSEPLKLSIESVSAKDLLEAVRQSMELVASLRNIDLSVLADDSMVKADEFQITRVLTNLCANAIKYTREGGSVTLSCHSAGANRVRFEVSDNGPGIAEHLAPKLFDRYAQGSDKDSRTGYGLGLFIAKAIVEAHGEGCDIGFRNKTADEGGGCILYFDLQAA